MKRKITKKKITVLTVLLVISIILGYAILESASFPGKITTSEYKVTTEGVKSTFHEGVIYRYPGMVPLLSVSGDHYEMGLQYGVLLRPEVMKALESYEKILRREAKEEGIPYPILSAVLKYKAKKLSKSLPDRFLEEIKGVSKGSGAPEDAIITISLFYDVSMATGCTGILMRGENGTIIHARNNDWFEGEELGKLTVVVRYNATGYNSVTHIDYPLWMGVETGYNDRGLAFSEETYGVKEPNPNGFSIVYLARIALEECSTLDEVYRLFGRYSAIGGYGTVWSDRDEGRGVVVELTPTAWAVKEMEGSILWNFNHIYDPELRKQQRAKTNIDGWNWDREEIASAFPMKPEYEIKDAVKFLRAQKAPDVHGDFSRPPELFMEAVPIKPAVEEAARIRNMLVSREEKLQAYVDLAQKYKDDANTYFLVAYHSFQQSRWDMFADYAEKAYSMKPFVTEYKLFAGIAAYQQKEPDRAIKLLESIEFSELHPWQEIYRLRMLEKAWASKNPEISNQYNAQKQAILDRYDAHLYYEKEIAPLFEELDTGGKEK